MRRFNMLEPKSIQDACEILSAEEDVKLISGGTALLILIKHGILLPKTLVNLKKIKGAAEITYEAASGLRIGGLASIFDVESAPAVRQHYPLLARACHVVANIRIRNMATIGGNLAHADSQSDPPAALIAFDASVELTTRDRVRTVKLRDFLIGSYETGLERDEILTALLVPPVPANVKGTYLKFTTRSSEDRPCAAVAAWVRHANGKPAEARVVVGAVSPAPVVLTNQGFGSGQKSTADAIAEIARNAAATVDPIDDLRGPADYKRQLVQVLVRRALTECAA
ncbi:MAG: xanthine dehydrogenase family protein subunit M [Candidatus Binatia bacterium]